MVASAPPAVVERAFIPPLHEGDAVPPAALIDQRGRPVDLARSGGRTTVVSFIDTHCADARECPLVAAKFARMQRELGSAPIRLVTITLDPDQDTPAVLARYGARYGADAARWSLVTGPASNVERLTARLGIVSERARPGVLQHTEAAIVLDARGRIARTIEGNDWLPDDALGAARDVAGIGDSPLHRVRLWLVSGVSAVCGGRASGALGAGASLSLLGIALAAFGSVFARVFRAAR